MCTLFDHSDAFTPVPKVMLLLSFGKHYLALLMLLASIIACNGFILLFYHSCINACKWCILSRHNNNLFINFNSFVLGQRALVAVLGRFHFKDKSFIGKNRLVAFKLLVNIFGLN